MSVPFGPVALSLEDITRQLRSTFAQFTDPRRGKNTRYTLLRDHNEALMGSMGVS